MRIFTLAVDEKGEVKLSGDIALTEVKAILDNILYRQAYDAGYNNHKDIVRTGYRRKRDNAKRKPH